MRKKKKKRITIFFPNSLPFPWRLISSHPLPLIVSAFRSQCPHSPVPSGTSESPSPDPVPTEARLHCPLLFFPNPSVLLLLLPLRNLSLRRPVSESLETWVFTVPLLPLSSPSPHGSAFTSQEPVASRPVLFRPSPLRSTGPHNPVPLSPLSLGCRLTPSPFPKSRLEPRSPEPRLLRAPSPSVPSQEPDS